jgi:hypothetical protein
MLGREPRRLYSLSRSEPTRGNLRIDVARINNELAFHMPDKTRRADYFGAHCRPHDTAVFMSPSDAWQQPLLRLVDTIVGIGVGVACKWVGSFLFYKFTGGQAT